MAAPMPSLPPGAGNALLGAPGAPAPAMPINALTMPAAAPVAPVNALAGRPTPPIPRIPRIPPRPGPINPGIQEVPRSTEGINDRVSTRIPTSAKLAIDPHERQDLRIGLHEMMPEGLQRSHIQPQHFDKAQAGIADAMAKTAAHIRENYPHIDPTGLTDRGTLERFIEHGHDNIVSLWNSVRDKPWRDAAVNWYRGANGIAGQLAAQHGGVSKRQAAAVIASLSPQKDWDQNVSLAERVLDTHRNHQDTLVTPQMRDFMQGMVDARDPKRRAAIDMLVNGGTHKTTGETYAPITTETRLRDLTSPEQQALFVRALDEMHSPNRGYSIISPTGARTPAQYTNAKGERVPNTVAWGGLGEISNAMRALSEDSRSNISRSLGGMHKVRNFYNNIVAPDSPHGDITADTHAINAAMMTPMGGGHPKVAEGLGSAGQAPAYSGSKGLYGLYADAHRRAADTISRMEGRRYLPREVQSVTWEAVRNLFKKEHKAIDENGMPTHPVGQTAHGALQAARHGFMPPEMARQAIIRAAGGIRDPSWHTGVMEADNG
jgi:hypothetical protein